MRYVRKGWKKFVQWAFGGSTTFEWPWLNSLLCGKLGARISFVLIVACTASVSASWAVAYDLSQKTGARNKTVSHAQLHIGVQTVANSQENKEV